MMWNRGSSWQQICPCALVGKGGREVGACVPQSAEGCCFFSPPWIVMHTVNFWVTGWQPSRSNHLPSTGISWCASVNWWAGSVCSADSGVAVANSIASPQSKKRTKCSNQQEKIQRLCIALSTKYAQMQADSSLPSLPRAQSVCFIRWCNRLLNNRQTWYELSYLSLRLCLHVEESCCIFHLTALQLAICHCPLLEKHEQSCQARGKENQSGIL